MALASATIAAQRAGGPLEISDAGHPHRRRLHAGRRQRHHRAASSDRNCPKASASPSSSTTSRAAARSSPPNMSPNRQPDGYTLLVGASGAMAINPAVYAKLPYDSIRDFVPVSELGSFPLILIVNAVLADQIGRRARRLRQGKSGQDQLFVLVRRVPAGHRIVQAEDRRADAGNSLQGRQRFGVGRDFRPGHRDHRRRRSGVEPGQGRPGAGARGRGAESHGGTSRTSRP